MSPGHGVRRCPARYRFARSTRSDVRRRTGPHDVGTSENEPPVTAMTGRRAAVGAVAPVAAVVGMFLRSRWLRVGVVVVLVVGVWVSVLGGGRGRGGGSVAWAAAGTSVGSSSYAVPAGAVVV